MARKAKPNSRTLLRYVCPEDTAIGLAPDTENSKAFTEGWGKYTDSFDETYLQLRPDETPSYYYIKPLTLDAQTVFFDALAESNADGKSVMASAFSPSMRLVLRDFVERFIVGCDLHEEVTSVAGDGSFERKSFTWLVGSDRPDGLTESIMADATLTFNLFMFAINSSKLSEKEKKR